MKRPNINTLIILGFVVMAIVIVGVIALILKVRSGGIASSASEPKMNSYTDPASGETILSPEGKLPEKYGTNPDAPIIIGFDKLFPRGLNSDQVDLMKAMLNDYADQVKSTGKITEISLVVDSVSHAHDRNTGEDAYNFSLLINRKDTYIAHVTIPDVDTVTLSLAKQGDPTLIYSGKKSSTN